MIPIFRLHYDSQFRSDFHSGMESIFNTAFLTDHSYVRRFEAEFAAWSGLPFAAAASSGTSALEAIFRALNVRGRKVIVPGNTFIATAAAVRNAGGQPLVVDVERRYLAPDLEAVRACLDSETAAVVTVHVGGLISPEILELQKICREAGVALVEDCAHAHGASLNGKPAGTFGIAGAFSFHVTKVMTTGEGGAVVCADADFFGRVSAAIRFGKDAEDPLLHRGEGGNSKMTETQGLMGCLELARVDGRIRRRQEIAATYQRLLAGSRFHCLTPAPGGVTPYYKQIVSSPFPVARIKSYLFENGVALTGGVYERPLPRQPTMDLNPWNFPVCEEIAAHFFCPPCYPELETNEAQTVCELLLDFERRNG